MCPARVEGGGTAAAVVAAVAAAPGCAVLVLVSTSPCKLLIPAAKAAVSRCCFVGGPGCAAPTELSEFCGWPRGMFTMEVSRCRLVGMPDCAALTVSKGRLLAHPATASCSAVLAAPASAAGCSALVALGSTLLAAPARAAGYSALLAGAPVRPSRLARNLMVGVVSDRIVAHCFCFAFPLLCFCFCFA